MFANNVIIVLHYKSAFFVVLKNLNSSYKFNLK